MFVGQITEDIKDIGYSFSYNGFVLRIIFVVLSEMSQWITIKIHVL